MHTTTLVQAFLRHCKSSCIHTAGALQSIPPTVADPLVGEELPVSISNADVLPGILSLFQENGILQIHLFIFSHALDFVRKA